MPPRQNARLKYRREADYEGQFEDESMVKNPHINGII